jgi:hypothetical protein
MRLVILFCLLGFVSLGSTYCNKSTSDEYTGVYFLKSILGDNFSAGDFSNYSEDSIKNVVKDMANTEKKDMANTEKKDMANTATDCDKMVWLHCGVEVLHCVETCRNGTLGSCIDCLGGTYKDCCGCLKEYVPKIPCQSSIHHN